jgi:hypothetical protein
MTVGQILGAVLLVVGIVLVFFAIQASNAPLEQLSEALTGRFTWETMWYWILGIAGIVAGGLLLLFSRK